MSGANALSRLPLPYDERRGYTDQFNTQLTPDEEAAYQAWGAEQAATRKDKRNPAADVYDYDMRGFWKSGGEFSAENGHAGDAYKKPNHPTFSNLSRYSTEDVPGGRWARLKDGSWTFAPSPHNLRMHTPESLQRYFSEQEMGNQLLLPSVNSLKDLAP